MDLIPDNEYFHSTFGSDKEKCPEWFAGLFGLCLILTLGTIGLILISVVF